MASEHLTEDQLIDYESRALDDTVVSAFEEHLLICEWCRARLNVVQESLEALRKALGHLQAKKPEE